MTVKPWAGFIADFPDDTVEEGGDITLFGGRNVAVGVGEILIQLGCRVSAPEYAELNGWDFDLYYRDRRFWCQVSSFHPAYLLLFKDPAFTRGTRKRNYAAYAELAEKLAATLEEDGRFYHVEWRTWEEGPPEPDEIGWIGPLEPASPIRRDSLALRCWKGILGIWKFLVMLTTGYLFVGSLLATGAGALMLVLYVAGYSRDRAYIWLGAPLVCVGGLVFWLLLGRSLWFFASRPRQEKLPQTLSDE